MLQPRGKRGQRYSGYSFCEAPIRLTKGDGEPTWKTKQTLPICLGLNPEKKKLGPFCSQQAPRMTANVEMVFSQWTAGLIFGNF